MAQLKLTTWNIEHFAKLLEQPGPTAAARLRAIATEVDEIAPDILCAVEGPGNLTALRRWVDAADGLAGRYVVATIPGTEAILQQNPPDPRAALRDLYGMQGTRITGNQRVWFLVRRELFETSNARMQDPRIWKDLTKQPWWPVYEPGSSQPRKHSHWRHPQSLLLDVAGKEIEVIGVHLKSKINQKNPFDGDGVLTASYIDEARRARTNLTTEAYDIRRYVERRFEQDPGPRIFVCGDLNDGPGRDFFERAFLYFDLVSNIQGDVFFARRFLNHALFDFSDELRWTTNFDDRVERWSRRLPGSEALPQEAMDPTRFQLIDHILFTQALVGDDAVPRVRSKGGLVEHTIHQRVNAVLPAAHRTSDHRPVSVTMTF